MLFAIFAVLSVPALVFAQNINIPYPPDGTSISRGQNFTIEVDRPNSLSPSTEIALVIALQSCTSETGCASPDEDLGTILYNGSYTPKYESPSGWKPPHQNFTLMVPMTMNLGQAQLGVVHFCLIGAGRAPFLESKNVTVHVAE